MIPITIRFTVAILLIKSTLSVKVIMESDVHYHLGEERAIMSCSFNSTNTTAVFNILWTSDTGLGLRVLERDSSGAVFIGPQFNETASLGKGCTLILQNPKPEHNGTYWVRVIVAGEGADTKAVKLTIHSKENDKTYTRTVLPDQTPFVKNITTPPTEAIAVTVVAIVILLIVACCIIYKRNCCGENKSRLVIFYKHLRTTTSSSTTYSS